MWKAEDWYLIIKKWWLQMENAQKVSIFSCFQIEMHWVLYMIFHNKWLWLSFWKIVQMLFIKKRWSLNLIIILCMRHLSWKVLCAQSILIMAKSNNDKLCFTRKLKFCLVIWILWCSCMFVWSNILWKCNVKGFKTLKTSNPDALFRCWKKDKFQTVVPWFTEHNWINCN